MSARFAEKKSRYTTDEIMEEYDVETSSPQSYGIYQSLGVSRRSRSGSGVTCKYNNNPVIGGNYGSYGVWTWKR